MPVSAPRAEHHGGGSSGVHKGKREGPDIAGHAQTLGTRGVSGVATFLTAPGPRALKGGRLGPASVHAELVSGVRLIAYRGAGLPPAPRLNVLSAPRVRAKRTATLSGTRG